MRYPYPKRQRVKQFNQDYLVWPDNRSSRSPDVVKDRAVTEWVADNCLRMGSGSGTGLTKLGGNSETLEG
ncbi:hypothetical protein RRG08_048281 [Elysia crispata]|uniref:Uncharacterized protein n=1 Tax=Elysia crispata TaxID=231223 RepID=A0AAE0ZU57_9GAST|nr:hypothetical protein RRG08_048281 [Elysia crispata]